MGSRVGNPINGLREALYSCIGVFRGRLDVLRVDDQRSATTGGSTCADVPPPISDHIACRQIDAVVGRRLPKETGPRFTAQATVDIVMRADPDRIQRELDTQDGIYLVYRRTVDLASRQVRLVRDDNAQEAQFMEPVTALLHAWQYPQFSRGPRWIGLAVLNEGLVEDSVPV